jgi:hypothetical protein
MRSLILVKRVLNDGRIVARSSRSTCSLAARIEGMRVSSTTASSNTTAAAAPILIAFMWVGHNIGRHHGRDEDTCAAALFFTQTFLSLLRSCGRVSSHAVQSGK